MTLKPGTSEPSLNRPPTDRELQARFGVDGQADPMQKRPKGWGRRILIALVVMFVPGLVILRLWPQVAQHLAASAHLKSKGCVIEWWVDGSNWMQGGSTTVGAPNYWRGNGNLTDSDLPMLTKLHRVESLALSGGAGITPDGLKPLGDLKDLKQLQFCLHHGLDNCMGVHTTDAGLVHLRGLTQLEELSLSGSHIAGDGLAQLAPLVRLKSLDLDATELTDAGLQHLLALKSLESLSLRETKITDEGMAVLAKLPRLRTLNIEKTQVTPKGVFVVVGANPQADIYHDHTMDTFEKPEFVNSPQP